MPSFLSICLTILRIAIQITIIIQGILVEMHNAVEWLRDRHDSSITQSSDDQTSNQSLTEPSSSDVIRADEAASSRPMTDSMEASTEQSKSGSVTANKATSTGPLAEPVGSLDRSSKQSMTQLPSSDAVSRDTVAPTGSSVRSKPKARVCSSTKRSTDLKDKDSQRKHRPYLIFSPTKRISKRVVKEGGKGKKGDLKSPVKSKDDSSISTNLDQSSCIPKFRVERSTENVHLKTDVPQDSTSEPLKTSLDENNFKTPPRTGYNPRLKCDAPTIDESRYSPVEDRMPTRPHRFPRAVSSAESELREETLAKNYKCSGASAAQCDYKHITQWKRIPFAKFHDMTSTNNDKEIGTKNDCVLGFRYDSSTNSEVELKSTSERRPTPPPRNVPHEPSSSGTESGIFSEPNNLTIFVPQSEGSRLPSFRSPMKSQECMQNQSVRFIDQPLLTRDDRIDIIEKIEFSILPTIPPEAIAYPVQTVSGISTPISNHSDTPENIGYIEKVSEFLITSSNQCDKEQEFCEINSSATEFPVSGSSTSVTDSEDAIKSKNVPQILIESPSSVENDASPSKQLTTPSVHSQLPESQSDKSKRTRREQKFRKQPNETSTSEDENEYRFSRKRKASPEKLDKSPTKVAETTASKIKGFKFSPKKISNEEKMEESLTRGNASSTRSLDFESEIKLKAGTATNLSKNVDPKNLKLENFSPRTFEATEQTKYQQEISRPNFAESTSSKIAKNIVENSAQESLHKFATKLEIAKNLALMENMKKSNEQRSDSATEGKNVNSLDTLSIHLKLLSDKVHDEEKTIQRESLSNTNALSGEQESSDSLSLEATYSTSNDGTSKKKSSSESSTSEESKENEGDAAFFSSRSKYWAELCQYLGADKSKHIYFKNMLESPIIPTSCNPTDKILIENSMLEHNTKDKLEDSVIKTSNLQIDNVDTIVEYNKVFIEKSETSIEVEQTESKEESNVSSQVTVNLPTNNDLSEKLLATGEENILKNCKSCFSPNEVSNDSTSSNSCVSGFETGFTDSLPTASLASDKEEFVLEQKNLSESTHNVNIDNNSATELPASNQVIVSSTSECIQQKPTFSEPFAQVKEINKLYSEPEMVSPLLSPSKSSNSEVGETTVTKDLEETLGTNSLSISKSDLKKYQFSKSFFSPVLEELVERFRATDESNSATKTPSFASSPEVEESSIHQHSTSSETKVKKMDTCKSYFDPVLKELVQRWESTSVSGSCQIVTDETTTEMPEATSKISDWDNTSESNIENNVENRLITNCSDAELPTNLSDVKDLKLNVGNVSSNNLIIGAENDNVEFELHIVPQPVPYEVAIEPKGELLISNETLLDQNEIRIIDSKTPEKELSSQVGGNDKSTVHQPNTVANKNDDTCSSCPIDAVCIELCVPEVLYTVDDRVSLEFSTKETIIEVTSNELTANELSKVTKFDFANSTSEEGTKENSLENIQLKTSNENHHENTLMEIKEDLAESISVEITKKDSIETNCTEEKQDATKSILIVAANDDCTEHNTVKVSKDDSAKNNSETSIYSSKHSLDEEVKNDATENDLIDVTPACSTEGNALDTSSNLDSSFFAEDVDGKKDTSKENKPWKNKQRKSKKKRRN